MNRRVILGSVILCTSGGLLAASGVEPDRRNNMVKPVYGPPSREQVYYPVTPLVEHPWKPQIREFVIPTGQSYTAIMIVPRSPSGVQRVCLSSDRGEFPLLIRGGETFTLPFDKGWYVSCRAVIHGDLSDGDFDAWGIGSDGPVQFQSCLR